MLWPLLVFHLLSYAPCEVNPRLRVRVVNHHLIVDWVDV